MTAFRVVDPFNVYTDTAGQPLNGGSLAFYTTATTTPKNVYPTKALSVPNGTTVALDSSGRVNVDVWGSGSYRVRVLDSLGVQIGPDRDDVEIPGGGTVVLPSMTGNSGEFLTTNGVLALWEAIRQLPDPTGQAGKVVGTDGTVFNFQSAAAAAVIPVGGVALVTGGFRIGTNMVLTGTTTMPITGIHTTSKAITFPTPFNATPTYIGCSNMTGGISPFGAMGTFAAQGASATGFTINLDVNIDSSDPNWNVTVATVVTWVAIGPVTP